MPSGTRTYNQKEEELGLELKCLELRLELRVE